MNTEKALNHAWQYFQLHAQQRITTFNFYIVLTGLLTTGIATATYNLPQNAILTASLSVFLVGISYFFYKLDERVSFLIKGAEIVIIENEPADAKIFGNEIDRTVIAIKDGQWTYGKSFRTIFRAVAAVGVVVFLISIISLIKYGEKYEIGFYDKKILLLEQLHCEKN